MNFFKNFKSKIFTSKQFPKILNFRNGFNAPFLHYFVCCEKVYTKFLFKKVYLLVFSFKVTQLRNEYLGPSIILRNIVIFDLLLFHLCMKLNMNKSNSGRNALILENGRWVSSGTILLYPRVLYVLCTRVL